MEGGIRAIFRSHIWTLLVFLLMNSVVKCFGRQMRNGGTYQERGWNNAYHKTNAQVLVPQESCFYENYKRSLTCECTTTDMIASLDFKLGQHLLESGKDIREVHFRHCKELNVTLDYSGIDATNYPTHFRSIQHVNIKDISFEPRYSDRQELSLNFYNVDKLFFNELRVQGNILNIL